MYPLEDSPMIHHIEEGLDLEAGEMDIDGIDLQSIVDAVVNMI
jgi:hypothetical protein